MEPTTISSANQNMILRLYTFHTCRNLPKNSSQKERASCSLVKISSVASSVIQARSSCLKLRSSALQCPPSLLRKTSETKFHSSSKRRARSRLTRAVFAASWSLVPTLTPADLLNSSKTSRSFPLSDDKTSSLLINFTVLELSSYICFADFYFPLPFFIVYVLTTSMSNVKRNLQAQT